MMTGTTGAGVVMVLRIEDMTTSTVEGMTEAEEATAMKELMADI